MSNTKETEPSPFEQMDAEVIGAGSEMIQALNRSEIDIQISTAKAYPRSLTVFRKKVLEMATFNEEIAESCTYALPRREKDKITGAWVQKVINGPSVRLAEILAASYGNCRSAARVIHNDGRFITAQGIFHDLETNAFSSIEVKRKITGKDGRTFSEDMQVITGNAACKIAFRNAVFQGVPAALVADIYEKVQEVAKGTDATLVKRRDKALRVFFNTWKITEDMIFKKLGVAGKDDIDLDKLAVLNGIKTLLLNAESTVDELFSNEAETKDKAASAANDVAASMKEVKARKKNES